jgi:uncharacterized protein YbaP (TraB family)
MTPRAARFLRRLPAVLLALLAAGAAVPAAAAETPPPCANLRQPCRGLLWRIEKGSVPASHLFGTMHVSDPRVTRLAPPVKQALDGAASFTHEMFTNGPGIVHMAETMYFADHQRLATLLGPDGYRRLEATLKRHGIPTGDLDRKKPWAVFMMLAKPAGHRPGIHLDMALEIASIQQGKRVYALETMAEQISVFNDIPIPDQIVVLNQALSRFDQIHRLHEQMLQVYLSRDLHSLFRMIEREPMADERLQKIMLDRLLWARNRRMLERMKPRLLEGNAFIAVGAGHLPGDQGLLALLHRAGYRVTPIY